MTTPPLHAPRPLFDLAIERLHHPRAEDFADALRLAHRASPGRLDPAALGRLLVLVCSDSLRPVDERLAQAQALIECGATLDQTEPFEAPPSPHRRPVAITAPDTARGSPLFWAASRQSLALCEALLRAGADPLFAPALEQTPLFTALLQCSNRFCEPSDTAAAIAIALARASSESGRQHALDLAARVDCAPSVAAALVELGADPTLADPQDRLTPMRMAALRGRHALAAAMLSAHERRLLAAHTPAAPELRPKTL